MQSHIRSQIVTRATLKCVLPGGGILRAEADMLYNHSRLEEWLAWFVDPQTKDEAEIRGALESVPLGQEAWITVEVRLRVALHEARDALLPPVSSVGQEPAYRIYTDDDHDQWDTLDLKERLFFQEVNNRRPGGPRG